MTKVDSDVQKVLAQYIKTVSNSDDVTASKVAAMNLAWIIATNIDAVVEEVSISDTEAERVLQQMPTSWESEQQRDAPIGTPIEIDDEQVLKDIQNWHSLGLDCREIAALVEDGHGVSVHRDTVRRYVKQEEIEQ